MRKVKCDNSQPQCSNCRMSDLSCVYATALKRRGPKPRGTYHAPDIVPGPRPLPEAAVPMPWGPPEPSPVLTRCNRCLADSSLFTVPSTSEYSGAMLDHCGPLARLKAELSTALAGQSLESLVTECIDVYMKLLFPLMPIVHELTLRSNTSSILCDNGGNVSTPSHPSPGDNINGENSMDFSSMAKLRLATLITAVCAESALVLPAELFPKGPLLGEPFLRASRSLLRSFSEQDIERPVATSVIVRYFHSNCLHAAGKTRLSWYAIGEAIRLAQDMQLYSETSLQGLDEVETQLRRSIFWQLFTGDKSSAVLNSRPITLCEVLGPAKFTTMELSLEDTHLMDHTSEHNTVEFEQRLNVGFNLCQRLWTRAAHLLLQLRASLANLECSERDAVLSWGEESSIMQAYVAFSTALDDLPSWLQQPNSVILAGSTTTQEYQRRCFWSQRANLYVSFHCLRMIVLQRFAECNLSGLLGFTDKPALLGLRITDIAQDMIKVIQEAPFESIQVNGEPCVEKIRQIGASLLQIAHDTENQSIATRAKTDFAYLLDVLARLDSKASDSLAT
ncbi:C6 transcription factor [Pleurostoma richardsiae]|uniref:C6 transcription factor n=1 Tax=Pleurostoma richardsiae TaxID=41990 RepID=A0AA38VGK6_9PEZI|nr:C6 transcription factor [Pleurostoma richardsiae]